MDEPVRAALAAWSTFYVIIGSSAAALTGLQFVVQTLIAGEPATVGNDDPEGGINTFGSPTVVHFSVALLVSALVSAPWNGWDGLRATLGVAGIGALVYAIVVYRRASRQRAYTPVLEDWLFHVVFPVSSYAAMLVSAWLLGRDTTTALFLLAALVLLLVFSGIHNAWDTITFLTLRRVRGGVMGAAPAAASEREHEDIVV